jgi:TPR repeat protein
VGVPPQPRKNAPGQSLRLLVAVLLGLALAVVRRRDGPGDPRQVPQTESPRASNPPYDVSGIEGIVDIEAPDVETPAAVRAPLAPRVREATRKLPDLQARARAGNDAAMTSLALTQRSGLGGRAEPQSAIALLQRAAAAGNVHAMATLAEEYESGIWVAQDRGKAKSLREQAARAGSRLAQWELEP